MYLYRKGKSRAEIIFVSWHFFLRKVISGKLSFQRTLRQLLKSSLAIDSISLVGEEEGGGYNRDHVR